MLFGHNHAIAIAAAANNMAMAIREQKPQQTSSRILYDIPCKVCADHSSGKHYGIFACDGCAGFFKRSIRRNRQYVCKSKTEGGCVVDKMHRNQCRACRLRHCLAVGMNRDAVQHERGPRSATLRRQMAIYFKDHQEVAGPGSGGGSPHSAPESCSPLRPRSPATSASSCSPSAVAASAVAASAVAAAAAYATAAAAASPEITPDLMSAMAAAMARPRMPFLLDPRMLGMTRPMAVPGQTCPNFQVAFRPYATHSASKLHSQSAPSPSPLSLSPTSAMLGETLSEAAAHLLFFNVRWVQQVQAFNSLPQEDQTLLLEDTWRELFVLGAAQFSLPVEMAADVTAADPALAAELRSLGDAIAQFRALAVDATEFAWLRAVVLLRPCASVATASSAVLCALQDQAQVELSKYVCAAYPTQPSRFGKLLLLLPILRSVSAAAIADAFFRRTIGSIPLEKLICDMFKARSLTA